MGHSVELFLLRQTYTPSPYSLWHGCLLPSSFIVQTLSFCLDQVAFGQIKSHYRIRGLEEPFTHLYQSNASPLFAR